MPITGIAASQVLESAPLAFFSTDVLRRALPSDFARADPHAIAGTNEQPREGSSPPAPRAGRLCTSADRPRPRMLCGGGLGVEPEVRTRFTKLDYRISVL
jgi:hypothetical protein